MPGRSHGSSYTHPPRTQETVMHPFPSPSQVEDFNQWRVWRSEEGFTTSGGDITPPHSAIPSTSCTRSEFRPARGPSLLHDLQHSRTEELSQRLINLLGDLSRVTIGQQSHRSRDLPDLELPIGCAHDRRGRRPHLNRTP